MDELITLEPDPNIEPGHQWLVLPDTDEGHALVWLLAPDGMYERRNRKLYIAHDHHVDQRIVQLINALAHVRFSAPNLVQLTLTEDEPS